MDGSVPKRIRQAIKRGAVAVYRRVRAWDAGPLGEYAEKRHEDLAGCLTPAEKRRLAGAIFEEKHGYPLCWEEPTTFSEKIMWGMLCYQNPLRIRCNDKFAMKGYVEEVLGPGHTATLYGWWTDADDIDFDRLPQRFALKVNWGGGGQYNLYVPDKSALDTAAARRKLREWMQPARNIYYYSLRWDAQFVSPVVYAEEYLPSASGYTRPHDYKLYCFHGVCRELVVNVYGAKGAYSGRYDRDFKPLPPAWKPVPAAPPVNITPPHWDKMRAMAEALAKPFPFLRVDMYAIGDRILVGELTFACDSGRVPLASADLERELGSRFDMPTFVDLDHLLENDPLPAPQAYLLEGRLPPDTTRRWLERKALTSLFYYPDLAQPRTLNEKLLWVALHWQAPLRAVLADRCEMKRYLARTVGEQYVVPTLGVYADTAQIDWDALPEQFAAKPTALFGEGCLYLVRHKSCDSAGVFKAVAGDWLLPWNTAYYRNACLPGCKAEPRVLVEPLVGGGACPDEYRLYAAQGAVRLVCAVCAQGAARESFTYLDPDTWQALPVRQAGRQMRPAAPKPPHWDEMVRLCGQLAQGLPLARVDFWEADGRVYVNRLSCDADLFRRLEPVEWDGRLGGLFELPPSL